tara:strand:+ start:5246 stop:6079 length:834 start_codon:yes stop_codon:yes gene_type:complete
LFTFINSIDDLAVLNKELLNKPYLAVDTEFRRTTKDNMRLALLQVNDGEEIYLVDSILIKEPKGHASFLFSNSVVKIFHSCKEDIEAIYAWTGKVMNNLFDTQIAHAFLNGDFSIGYQGLVEEKLGIVIDKGETRSNWIRRPLTDSQLKYAVSDVEFLIELYLDQKKLLEKDNKLGWLQEELSFLSLKIFESFNEDTKIDTNLSRAEEKDLLTRLNQIVIEISVDNSINPTLFFSKKSQKDFMKLALDQGLDDSLNKITEWRSNLIKEPLELLLKDF